MKISVIRGQNGKMKLFGIDIPALKKKQAKHIAANIIAFSAIEILADAKMHLLQRSINNLNKYIKEHEFNLSSEEKEMLSNTKTAIKQFFKENN